MREEEAREGILRRGFLLLGEKIPLRGSYWRESEGEILRRVFLLCEIPPGSSFEREREGSYREKEREGILIP